MNWQLCCLEKDGKFTKRRLTMKKFVLVVLVAALFLGIGIQNASAATGAKKVVSAPPSEEYSLKRGTFGFGVDTGSDMFVNGRYLVMDDLAILVGFGLGIKGADAKGTDIGIGAGVRKYFKINELAPFVGGAVVYSSTNDSNVKRLGVLVQGGAEYFLSKHFSFEGTISLGYASDEQKNNNVKQKVSNVGTTRETVGFNFYF
jgi:hypothetical protein